MLSIWGWIKCSACRGTGWHKRGILVAYCSCPYGDKKYRKHQFLKEIIWPLFDIKKPARLP